MRGEHGTSGPADHVVQAIGTASRLACASKMWSSGRHEAKRHDPTTRVIDARVPGLGDGDAQHAPGRAPLSDAREPEHTAPDSDAGAGTRRLYLVGLFVAFLLLSAVLRLPTFGNHVFNTDEAYLATEAQVLERGGQLYVDAVDRKPPLVPYVYAATFETVGNDDLAAVRLLAVLAHAATALLLAVEARRRFRVNWSAAVAGILYLLAATAFRPQDAQAANFEVFMLPLMTAAMLLGIRRRTAPAGVTLAVATLAKQTAATTLLPLGWLAWRARRGTRPDHAGRGLRGRDPRRRGSDGVP